MKKIIYIISCLIISLLISSSACEEIINPKENEVLVEKTIQPSTTEQVVSYSNDITITIPSGALTKETKFTIKKGGSLPAMTLDKINTGTNSFRIIINGQQSYSSPVEILINYDESKIPTGHTADETIKGLLYKNNEWHIADFTLDKVNKKIRLLISDFKNQSGKRLEIPLGDEDSEVIVLPGYSQADTGSSDNPLAKTKQIYLAIDADLILSSIEYDSEGNETAIYDTLKSSMLPFYFRATDLKWNQNKFSATFNDVLFGFAVVTSISGEVNSEGTLVKEFNASMSGTRYNEQTLTGKYEKSIKLKNIPFSYKTPPNDPKTFIFTLDENQEQAVTEFKWYKELYDEDKFYLTLKETYFKIDWLATENPPAQIDIEFFIP